MSKKSIALTNIEIVFWLFFAVIVIYYYFKWHKDVYVIFGLLALIFIILNKILLKLEEISTKVDIIRLSNENKILKNVLNKYNKQK